MIMVSLCLPSDALSQHLLSYLGFSYLGRGVSLHGCSSKAQPLLLTLDEVASPDLERGVAPLRPPVPTQPPLLNVALLLSTLLHPRSRRSLDVALLLSATAPGLRRGVAPLGRSCAIAAWHSRLYT